MGAALFRQGGVFLGFVAGARFGFSGQTDGQCDDCDAVQLELSAGPLLVAALGPKWLLALRLEYGLSSPDLIGHRWGEHRIQPAHVFSLSAAPIFAFSP